MLKFQPIMLLIITVLSALVEFISGGLSHVNDFMTYAIYNGLYHGILGLFRGIVICGFASLMYGTIKLIYKNKVEKTKTEIIVLENLKENYEIELSETKEKIVELHDSLGQASESVSLIEYNNNKG